MDELLLQAFADEIQPGTPPGEALVWEIGPERKDVFLAESPSVAKARNLDDYARILKWREAHLYGYTRRVARSEEHTSELQSLMRISYAVFCLKKKHKTK